MTLSSRGLSVNLSRRRLLQVANVISNNGMRAGAHLASRFNDRIFRIALLAVVMQGFFLFTANYCIPGGAAEFLVYAELLVRGGVTHSAGVVSRDIGYPLLLVLSGLLFTKSLIGITIIQSAMAAMIPLLTYFTISPVSARAAYLAGLASAVSLVPFAFVKWIHHDQLYVFCTMLAVCLFSRFVGSKKVSYLYWFTLAIIATSLARPAGNLLFPVLIVTAYVLVRGSIKPYALSVLMFVIVAGLYQVQRYEMFDMANRTEVPSYTGQQIFYNLYRNSAEYGIVLSEDLGPNLKRITDKVHDALLPDPRSSRTLRSFVGLEQSPNEF
jgi:Dolichyl-phosphate-mannose-protein mannosyltransferase